MSSSKPISQTHRILCIWAPILVTWFFLQHSPHYHNLVLGFEYIEWREFRSRDDVSLGISLARSSKRNETIIGNGTAGSPRPRVRIPREINFYQPYDWLHIPAIDWKWSAPGELPLPMKDGPDWYRHRYTARNSLFPSQSLIILKDKEGKPHTCGCIILHNDLIMTTRRCIESKVAAKVVVRRNFHKGGIKEHPTIYAFVKGFCVLDKNSKDYENDVAIGYLSKKIPFQGIVWPAAAIPDDSPPAVQYAGVVREGSFNGYNLLQKGCSKSPGGQEKDRTCYTTTSNGSRHICEGVDHGMGVYHLSSVEQADGYLKGRVYLAGIMSQAEKGPPGCQAETPGGQWVYYVNLKKIPRLREMITKCYS